MSTPTEPRQWGPANSEPDRNLTLQDQDGDLIAYNFDEERGGVGWRFSLVKGRKTYYGGVPWSDLDDEFDVAWPLTELLPAHGGEVVEYRPDSQLVDDTRGIAERCYFEGCPEWITGASDYCPEHAKLYAPEPRQWRTGDAEPADRPDVTDFDGDLWHWDPQVEQWRHKTDTFHWGELVLALGPLDEVPVPASSVAPSPTHTTTPVPQDPGTGAEALREALVELIDESAHADWYSPLHKVADAILAAGWRPPLPDSETEWGYRAPWGATTPQPSEAAARRWVDMAIPGARVLVRREVGPWTTVPTDHQLVEERSDASGDNG